MDDLISRQAAVEAINKSYEDVVKGLNKDGNTYGLISAVTGVYKNTISLLPSEEPQRMRAKWIATTSLQEGQITWIDYKCSNCSHHRSKPMNFCEVCGRKMERGEAIK